ncbi:DUF262 domain-containing protein [Kytococcus schroeteri]|uniref:DUF262 domain-containing protein n=1 Tax=Kytococcus schroeteri TaxID=138300 RepID=UPI0035EEBC56
MKAEEVQFAKLFHADNQQLRIPLWQRHYSWEKPHWQELWSDLVRVREKGLDSHFLGSVVLEQLPWSGLPSEARGYWVVDGQQRVTTLTIVICAMRDRLAALAGSDEDAERERDSYTRQLLKNSSLNGEQAPRLVLQERDQVRLMALINNEFDGVSQGSVDGAYVFFSEKVADLDKAEIEALMKVILTRFLAVWVTLQEGDNAHRVFQTLNAGGKKLRQSDLVRNYFFLLLGAKGDEFYRSRWRALEAGLDDSALEDYMVAWSISQGYTGSKDSLFKYFQEDLRGSEHEIETVLDYGLQLTDAARMYRWLRHPNDADLQAETRTRLRDLATWRAVPAEGLVLWLLRRWRAGVMSEADLRTALDVVMSFLGRRQLAGAQPNLHKSIFVSATKRLAARSDLSGKDVPHYLRFVLSQGEEVRVWPRDEVVRAASLTVPVYSRTRSHWALVILDRINRAMFDFSKHVPEIGRGTHSVEHVMPQTLTDEWRTELTSWGVQSPLELHESHLHVLGNLTITPINSELSNLPFGLKREKLSDDWLKVNTDVASNHVWTGSRIDERSIKLADLACRAFSPGPMTSAELHEAAARFHEVAAAEESEEELLDEEL